MAHMGSGCMFVWGGAGYQTLGRHQHRVSAFKAHCLKAFSNNIHRNRKNRNNTNNNNNNRPEVYSV